MGQPPDRLRIAGPGAARKVLGPLQGRRTSSAQPQHGLAVAPEAYAAGQVLVEGIADQVVAEPEPLAVIGHHPGLDRLGQRHRELAR